MNLDILTSKYIEQKLNNFEFSINFFNEKMVSQKPVND